MATFHDRPNPLDELHEAVSLLLDPQPAAGWEDVRLPALIDQLVDAAESSSSRGGAARSKQTVPASLDVLGLLNTIDRWVGEGLRSVGYRGRLDLPRPTLIRLWVSHAGEWRSTRPEYLHDVIGQVRRWVIRAENILAPDPQMIETKAQPCPSCQARTAMVWSDDVGEKVQRPSLYLDIAHMIVFCRCCGAQWSEQMWAWLRTVLEYRPAPEQARSSG